MIILIFIEETLPILYDGKETNYLITESGRVINKKSDRELKPAIDKDGYKRVLLMIKGQRKMFYVHRLVALHFVPNPNNYPVVDHLDGNKQNNFPSNLEWVTVGENTQRAYNMGLAKAVRGENHGESKYTNEQVTKVCELLVHDTPYKIIQEITGVDEGVIYKIRHRKSWTHISKDYDFPELRKARPRKIPNELKEEMNKLIKEGYDNRSILKKLGMNYTDNNRSILKRLRKKL